MSPASPVGTLAYVIEEEALLVRVNKGWQYIAVRLIALCVIFVLPVNCDTFTVINIKSGSSNFPIRVYP